MNPLRKAYYILRYLGPGFAWTRARIAVEKRLGHAKRVYAPRAWDSIELPEIAPQAPRDWSAYAAWKRDNAPPFLFPLGQPPMIDREQFAESRSPSLAERIALLRENRCVYFFRTPAPKAIDWRENALDGSRGDSTLDWHEIPDFLPGQGDIRSLWEPARAAWAIDLARAHARRITPDATALYWRWLDSWLDSSPPFRGVHWKCGQESSVRFLALAIGFWALADSADEDAWRKFTRLAWATGYRVYHHIDYAVSQNNNHALSEAVGLLLVSGLFPEFQDAPRWAARGRQVLADGLKRQFYGDGAYVQHSFNYQRVALQMGMLGLRLAELAKAPFERGHYDRLGRCVEFLFEMMEPRNGRLPNYGHNDGALVLPLSECDFQDYRPALQAGHFLAQRKRLLPTGAWDEDLRWLFGAEADKAPGNHISPRKPQSSAFRVGGYCTLRSRESWAMIRCHTYRDRPSQNDNLHLDLWWRGQNVLCDAGTYLYYVDGRADLERYFRSAAAHNVAQIDQREPFESVTRFLWFPWPRATLRRFEREADRQIFEGESHDYERAPWRIKRRRSVIAYEDDTWVVIDDFFGRGEHEFALHWHCMDAPLVLIADENRARLETPAGQLWIAFAATSNAIERTTIVRGRDEPGSPQGWSAPYYAERQPNPTLEIVARSVAPLRIVTVISPRAMRAAPETTLGDAERWRLNDVLDLWQSDH